MKKLKLNFQHFDDTEVLTREQLKKITGGEGSDSGGGTKKQKCCPKNDCNSPQCSSCVVIPPGHHADCSANANSQVCNC
ncbi:MAG: hypothetical protein H3C48_10895 [Chitinophagaceae bacterium]|nr:hypothetical protein [Chitinophagaceae bacterium]